MKIMNDLALVCGLLLVAGAVEWVGSMIIKRFNKQITLLFSFSVWGSLMIFFSVIWLLK